MKESLEEVMEKYKLTEEENKRIGEEIKKVMLLGKTPVKNPVAIFTIAPPGSGKTGLNGFSIKQIENDNIIVINNDELKPFHPKADEISKLYPEYYIKVTNEESKIWTDSLMDKALEEGYNVMYEGTGRKIQLFERMISKMDGYKIIVRAMAVNELNCLMSILERYEYQIKTKGWGRLVAVDTFYKSYEHEMLETIDTFEKKEMVDVVEVYTRGNVPSEPIKIYGSNEKNSNFSNAKYAIIQGRERDAKEALVYYESYFNTIKEILNKKELTQEEQDILNKVQKLYKEFLNKDEREAR